MTFCESLPLWNLWIVNTFSVLSSIATFAVAYYIFVKLNEKERPNFVTYQTLLLFFGSILCWIYYSLLIG